LAKKQYGNTMRLGAYPCILKKNSLSLDLYGRRRISERHRHRYEFNNKYRRLAESKGLIIAGVSPDNQLVEIVELPRESHPFFVGVQFHPELKSRPLDPHPLFVGLIGAGIKRSHNA
jgi:CTP synthase